MLNIKQRHIKALRRQVVENLKRMPLACPYCHTTPRIQIGRANVHTAEQLEIETYYIRCCKYARRSSLSSGMTIYWWNMWVLKHRKIKNSIDNEAIALQRLQDLVNGFP